MIINYYFNQDGDYYDWTLKYTKVEELVRSW